jgi:hypothetical protein
MLGRLSIAAAALAALAAVPASADTCKFNFTTAYCPGEGQACSQTVSEHGEEQESLCVGRRTLTTSLAPPRPPRASPPQVLCGSGLYCKVIGLGQAPNTYSGVCSRGPKLEDVRRNE